MNLRRSVGETLLFALPLLLLFAFGYAYVVVNEAWKVSLARPAMLLLAPAAALVWLLGVIVLRKWRASPGDSSTHLGFSRASEAARMPAGLRARLVQVPAALRLCAIVLLAVALARPQRVDASESLELSGIDIVLVLDMSGSMRAADLQPTRLQAAKEVILSFIDRRRTDRIGLVVFGREAFPALAPTLDYAVLRGTVQQMELEVLSEESRAGTAIGDGLGTALNYLRRSDAHSKVVVLLTDGSNNAGHVDPRHAAQFANALRVKVYTVLMGQSDQAPIVTGTDQFGRPVVQMANFPVDPALLQHIAQESDGQFFRAVDRAGLEFAFHTILDRLERSRIADAGVRPTEMFVAFALPAALLLALEILLASTWLRRFP